MVLCCFEFAAFCFSGEFSSWNECGYFYLHNIKMWELPPAGNGMVWYGKNTKHIFRSLSHKSQTYKGRGRTDRQTDRSALTKTETKLHKLIIRILVINEPGSFFTRHRRNEGLAFAYPGYQGGYLVVFKIYLHLLLQLRSVWRLGFLKQLEWAQNLPHPKPNVKKYRNLSLTCNTSI